MDPIASATTVSKKPGFFKHVFHDNSKGELLNIMQYCLFVIIPLGILIRNVNFFFPKVDKTKGSVELVAEALGQLCLTFIILFFVHRILTYFSPWGEGDVPALNFPTLIMVFVWIVLSFGLGHVGSKIDLVWNRILPLPRKNFWDEDTESKKKSRKKGSVVKVTQPLARLPPPIPTHQVSRADYINSQNKMAPPIVPQLQRSGNFPSLPGNDNGNQPYGTMSQYNQALDIDTSAQNPGDQNFDKMYSNGGNSENV